MTQNPVYELNDDEGITIPARRGNDVFEVWISFAPDEPRLYFTPYAVADDGDFETETDRTIALGPGNKWIFDTSPQNDD